MLRWCFVRWSEGVGYGMRGTEVMEISAAEALVIPPGAAILLRASRLGHATLHYFNFQPDRMASLMTLAERQQFSKLAALPDQKIWRLEANHEMAAQFGNVCERHLDANPFWERCRLLSLAASWFDPALKSLPNPDDSTLSNFSAQKRFLEIVQQMPATELLARSPAELAKLCRCSVTRFRRLFRSQFGMSFRSKQVQLRLEIARQLLRESNVPIKEVGRSCGYAADGTFSTMFKKHFGISPRQMRLQPETTAGSPDQPS